MTGCSRVNAQLCQTRRLYPAIPADFSLCARFAYMHTLTYHTGCPIRMFPCSYSPYVTRHKALIQILLYILVEGMHQVSWGGRRELIIKRNRSKQLFFCTQGNFKNSNSFSRWEDICQYRFVILLLRFKLALD